MSSVHSEDTKFTQNEDDNEFARAVFKQTGIKDEDFEKEYAKNQEFIKEMMINQKKDKKKFGLGNILKKGIGGVASVVMDEVSSSISLVAEMEKYPDSRLIKIVKTGSTKQKSAAAYVLKKRGY
jgi:hypothetical protein